MVDGSWKTATLLLGGLLLASIAANAAVAWRLTALLSDDGTFYPYQRQLFRPGCRLENAGHGAGSLRRIVRRMHRGSRREYRNGDLRGHGRRKGGRRGRHAHILRQWPEDSWEPSRTRYSPQRSTQSWTGSIGRPGVRWLQDESATTKKSLPRFFRLTRGEWQNNGPVCVVEVAGRRKQEC
jgi:hypothetical protein